MSRKERQKKSQDQAMDDPISMKASQSEHSVEDQIYGEEIEYENEKKYKYERWSRIIKINETEPSEINLQYLKDDIHQYHKNPMPLITNKKKPWSMVFDPELLVRDDVELKLDNFRLSRTVIKNMAIKCSNLR